MVVFPVLSETPHYKGNESQDTITLLETMLMSIERETRLPEEGGFTESTRIKLGTDE
jgi:hypothetical protein